MTHRHLLNRLRQLQLPVFFLFFCSFVPVCASAAVSYSPKAIREHIQGYLECGEETETPSPSSTEECMPNLFTVYLASSGNPLWVDSEGPTENGWIVIGFLRDSNRHGLQPARYNVETIQHLLPSQMPESLALLDTLLTKGIIRYIEDITTGTLPQSVVEENNDSRGNDISDPLILIQDAIHSDDLKTHLTELAPRHTYYTALQQKLELYRSIAASGGWLKIPDGIPLRPGDIDSRIKAVKLRLLKTDWNESAELTGIDGHYSPSLEKAVIRFQKRHKLTGDGVIGRDTISAMNIPVNQRIETIRLNLLRWHGMAHDLGDRYVLVNITGYTLDAVENDQVVLNMPVVVGSQENKTPAFSDRVKYIVFNPFWTITPNIAKTEELMALRENPNHLVERHIRLFSSWFDDAVEIDSTTIDWYTITPEKMGTFRLRQDPGPWNSLGKLKFVFPNHYSVYLHDTSAHRLFNLDERTLSHGCVRVSNPPALAGFFLKDQQKSYSEEDILMMYNQNERIVIPLSDPVPVHLTYQTVQVDKEGTIHFNSDIYGHDSTMRRYLYSK